MKSGEWLLLALFGLGFLSSRRVEEVTTPMNSLMWGAWIDTVSYGRIYQHTLRDTVSRLDLVDNLPISIYSIHPNYDLWFNNDPRIEMIDYVVARARGKGVKVAITESMAESFLTKKITIDQAEQYMLKSAETYIQRYHPDYYYILHEPNGWMNDRLISPATPLKWAEIGSKISAYVKSLDRGVKTGHQFIVSPNIWSKELTTLKACLNDPNLGAIGFDIYGLLGKDNKTSLIDPILPSIVKEKVIPETYPYTKNTMIYENPYIVELWFRHIKQYCLTNKFSHAIIFFTMRLENPLIFQAVKRGIS